MLKCLYVGLGGFIGSIGRYLIGLAFIPIAANFPFGTLLINFAGSFVIGIINEFSVKITPVNPKLLLFLTVGICGGFTTFSTFSLETINLFEKSKVWLGAGYVVASVISCLAGVILGKFIIRYFADL